MLGVAMSVSPTSTRHKRRRDSYASISVQASTDKCIKRIAHEDISSPTDTGLLNVGILTTSFEPSIDQSDAEAIAIAAEMSIDFYNEVYVLYNMMSDIRQPSEETKTMDILVQRLSQHVQDERVLSEAEKVRNIYCGMMHVYVYLYRVHFRQFQQLDMAAHLSLCWHRLVAFGNEYRVLDSALLHRSYEYTMQIVRHCESHCAN